MRPRTPALLILTLLIPAACGDPPPGAGSPDPGEIVSRELSELHAAGASFPAFLETAESRVETWTRNWEGATVPPELLERARAVPGSWRLLVVAEDYCGDSANTVPYVARLARELEGLELRIVDSSAGRAVMESHPTPDGRAATPTMVLLDPEGVEAGCLVEQPQPLQRWWLGEGITEYPELEDRLAVKYRWYDQDAGVSTMSEVVALMEAAAAGDPVCRAVPPVERS